MNEQCWGTRASWFHRRISLRQLKPQPYARHLGGEDMVWISVAQNMKRRVAGGMAFAISVAWRRERTRAVTLSCHSFHGPRACHARAHAPLHRCAAARLRDPTARGFYENTFS